MKSYSLAFLSAILASTALADPIVGAKAVYDYRRSQGERVENVVLTREVLSVDFEAKTFAEKIVYTDMGGNVLKEGTVEDQPFDAYEFTDIFFVTQCATSLNGNTIDGVTFAFVDVEVPMGAYRACRMSYVHDGLQFENYVVDEVPFTLVKSVVTETSTGMVRTSELRSVELP